MTTISLVTVPILGQMHIPQALSKSLTFCASRYSLQQKRRTRCWKSKSKANIEQNRERNPSCKVHLVCEGQTPTQNLETRSLSAKEIKTQHKTNSISNQWKSFLRISHTKVTCKVSSKSHAETQGHCLPHPLQQHLDEAVLFWDWQRAPSAQEQGWSLSFMTLGRFWADDCATEATNYDERTHINRI